MNVNPRDKTLTDRIVAAIRNAETGTNATIAVRIQRRVHGDVRDAAEACFLKLGLNTLTPANAVLWFLAYDDQKLAVLGGADVDRVVPDGFWQECLDAAIEALRESDLAAAVEAGLVPVAHILRQHFPAGSPAAKEETDHEPDVTA